VPRQANGNAGNALPNEHTGKSARAIRGHADGSETTAPRSNQPARRAVYRRFSSDANVEPSADVWLEDKCAGSPRVAFRHTLGIATHR
jgi:hypothetical protein